MEDAPGMQIRHSFGDVGGQLGPQRPRKPRPLHLLVDEEALETSGVCELHQSVKLSVRHADADKAWAEERHMVNALLFHF